MEWQPIKTAPRDDTIIICYNKNNRISMWCYNEVMRPSKRGKNKMVFDKGWTPMNHPTMIADKTWAPTHWMPLPEPPPEKQIKKEATQ